MMDFQCVLGRTIDYNRPIRIPDILNQSEVDTQVKISAAPVLIETRQLLVQSVEISQRVGFEYADALSVECFQFDCIANRHV